MLSNLLDVFDDRFLESVDGGIRQVKINADWTTSLTDF